MSLAGVVQVVERASVDAAFRARLVGGEAVAIQDYDLDPAERAALLSSTPEQLQSLALDPRSSKWGGDVQEQDSAIEWYQGLFH